MNKRIWLVVMAAAFALAGCDQGSDKNAPTGAKNSPEPFPSDPVTLKVINVGAGINNEQDLEEFFSKPVKKKYPNISFELVKGTLEEMTAAGTVPDLIASSIGSLFNVKELGLTSDLTEMAKKEKIDMPKLEPAAMEYIKSLSDKGELLALPFAYNQGVLLYNKDIFDKMGVGYPKDGMYWDEVIELGKKLTRTLDGKSYIGIDPRDIQYMLQAKSIPVIDKKTGKAVIDTDAVRDVFKMYQQILDIPGYVSAEGQYYYGINAFIKEQRLAMYPYPIAALQSNVPTINEAGIKWDIVSSPQFRDRKGYTSLNLAFQGITVPPSVKNKEAAYKAISTILSEEAQTAMNKSTRLTIYNDPAMRSQFASESNAFNGKNIKGVFTLNAPPYPYSTKYDTAVNKVVENALKRIAVDKVDLNTALREADAEANKVIETMGK